MLKAKLPLFGLIALSFFLLLPYACVAKPEILKDCGSSHCGNVTVKYPFRLKGQPPECGDSKLQMVCDNNNLTIFASGKTKLFIQEISYEYRIIQVMDGDNEEVSRLHCSLPCNSFVPAEFAAIDSNSIVTFSLKSPHSVMNLVNCTKLMGSSRFVDASRCSNSSSHPPSSYFYFIDGTTPLSDLSQSCTVTASLPVMLENITGMSTRDVYQKLLLGYELEWRHYMKGQVNVSSFEEM
ncbi:hypothetical protein DITRI_Ditri02bG0166300 [Diplodiscus trichospermus]